MRDRFLLLPALSLLSGTTALVYETVWLRWFRLLFGSTAYAASATLAAFFAGLAIGAYFFGRRVERSRQPLRLYAGIELGAAAAALIVPFAVAAYEPIYAFLYDSLASSRGVFVLVKFSLSFIAIVPAATLLGGTLPALAAAYVGDRGAMGRRTGTLYALNTLGAAVGSAAGALWLPDAIGVRATYAVAIGLSLLIALIAFLASRGSRRELPDEVPRAALSAPRGLLAIACVSGFGTLAFEVLLIHAIALSLQNSVYSFGAVLIVVLLALASGAALATGAAAWIRPRTLLAWALLVEALMLLVLPFATFVATARIESHLVPTFSSGMGLAALLGGPALLVAGFVLPLTFKLAEGGSVGPRVGGLLASNTLGGIAGSVCASFLLLDWLGLWTSMGAVALVYAVAAVAVPGSGRARSLRAAAIAAVAVAVASSGANPLGLSAVRIGPGERLVAMAEGAHGVVSVIDVATQDLKVDRHLKVDNEYVLSGSLAQTHQRRMGHLPLLLHRNPKRVMFVGSATGETSSSALLHPVAEIVLVELVPEVQQLAAEHFAEANRGVYRDVRTRVVVEDGRNHIRGAPERYDVIVTDLFVPGRPGVGAMYSLEHFRAAAQRLNPGGVFCIWLPVYQHHGELFRTVVATFLEVFPDATLWRSDFFVGTPTAALIGISGQPPAVEEIDAAVRRMAGRGVEDRWVSDPEGFWMFYLGRAADAVDLAGVRLNTDDRPLFEYQAGRANPRAQAIFRLREWPAITERVIESAGPVDSVFPGRSRDAALAGVAYRRAAELVLSGGLSRTSEARTWVEGRVPATLLATPDPTVSEIWPLGEVR